MPDSRLRDSSYRGFRALALLFRKEGDKNRMVQALTIRVALSVGLFLMLLAGFYFGIIPQRGLR